jgi:ATP-dependent DNA helicase RecG
MTTLKLVGSPWRSDTFRRLSTRLENILGSKTAKLFEPLKVFTVGDLMRLVPRRYFSGTELSDLSVLRDGEEVAVMAEVVDAKTFNLDDRPYVRARSKPRLEATITDRRGNVVCTFFGQPRLIRYWQDQLHPGARGIFAGKVTRFNGRLQLAHPDFVLVNEHGDVIGGTRRNAALASASNLPLVGLYPLTAKLRTWTIAECAALALDSLAGIEDPLPERVREAADVMDLESAFRAVHQPTDKSVISEGRQRLRFDEAFALQLTMAYRRADAASHRAVPRTRRSGGLLDAFDERLPFVLTEGQIAVSEEIMTELGRDRPMQRLLQGEVGSGKTLVALRAMLAVVDAGGQAALLAPTEVLAGQHYQTITRMLGELASGGTLGAPEQATGVVLITGSSSAARRREATLQAASGAAGIVIGTHALLSADVQFADLGLVVVDEQHRFGVEQRAALSAKRTPDHMSW